MKKWVQLQCNALPGDAYPAGLGLASDLWTAAKRDSASGLMFTGIVQFWDGVRLIGFLDRRQFGIEINYGTETIVCLTIEARKRLFENRTTHAEFLASVRRSVAKVLFQIEGRREIDS